jgi:hypothetical protein
LGFFKEEQPVEFLQSLSGYAGSCLWNNDNYNFMINNLDGLPQGCTATGIYGDSQQTQELYIDLKPQFRGKIDIGVYTDDRCSAEYTGGMATKNILKQYVNNQSDGNEDDGYYDGDNDGDDKSGSFQYNQLSQLNEALQTFHTCQPCRTYDLSSKPSNNDDDEVDENDPDQGYFMCRDSDGNDGGVNQCSIFQQATDMRMASYRDIALARQQGAILPTYVGEDGWWFRYGFLTLSIMVFVMGAAIFYIVASGRRKRVSFESPSEPLIMKK